MFRFKEKLFLFFFFFFLIFLFPFRKNFKEFVSEIDRKKVSRNLYFPAVFCFGNFWPFLFCKLQEIVTFICVCSTKYILLRLLNLFMFESDSFSSLFDKNKKSRTHRIELLTGDPLLRPIRDWFRSNGERASAHGPSVGHQCSLAANRPGPCRSFVQALTWPENKLIRRDPRHQCCCSKVLSSFDHDNFEVWR